MDIMNLFFHFQAGSPWFSILTRTGVFKGKENHDEYPADLVREQNPGELCANLTKSQYISSL